VYNCLVGPGVPFLLRGFGDEVRSSYRALWFDSPDEALWQANRWGAKAKPPVFLHFPRRLCCEPTERDYRETASNRSVRVCCCHHVGQRSRLETAACMPSAWGVRLPLSSLVRGNTPRRSIGVMTGRTNWSRIKQRSLMRRRGVEDVKGATPVAVQPPKQPHRKLSKAELREQAAAAFLAWRAGQTSKNK